MSFALKQMRKLKNQTGASAVLARMLMCISGYIKIRKRLEKKTRRKKPSEKTGDIIAYNAGQPTAYFARRIRSNIVYFRDHQRLKPCRSGNKTTHACFLDNETVRLKCLAYLALQDIGEIGR